MTTDGQRALYDYDQMETSDRACAADPSDSEPGAGWTEVRRFSLDQGMLSEAGISMRAGDSVDIESRSSGPRKCGSPGTSTRM